MSSGKKYILTIDDLFQLCLHRWYWFVISVAVMLALAFFHLARTPKRYTSVAALLVNEESLGKSTSHAEDFSDLGLVTQVSNVPNVVRHISSLDVLMEVARRQHPEADEKMLLSLAEDYKSSLYVERESEKSSIVGLSYDDYSPEKATEILTMIIEVYNEKWQEEKHMLTRNTSAFIDTRLRLLDLELDRVDDSISTYKSRYGITDLSSVSDMYLKQQSEADAKILAMTNQRAMADYIRELVSDSSDHRQMLLVNSGISNPVIESQITQYNTLLMQLNSHLTYTSDQNPMIVNLENEIDNMRKAIQLAIDKHIQSLDIELAALQGYHDDATAKITSNPEQAKYLTAIERDQKVKESLYLYLLQKKEENEISITYDSSSTRVIDMPHAGSTPTSPVVSRILLAAILLGLMIPLTWIFLKATLGDRVRSRSDIEQYTDLPLLGEVPGSSIKGKWKFFVVSRGKKDYYNDAFRMLRARLELTAPENEHVFLVAASEPGAGKSFVSMNLSLAFALGGKKVLLIDGDLRRAEVSRHWKSEGMGLADYLEGKTENWEKCISRQEEYPGLDVLPVGHISDDPAELLLSDRFGNLMKELRARYSVILIDSPSSRLIADSDILLRHADGTLFVVRIGKTDRRNLSALNENPHAGGKSIYLILNMVDGKDYYYYS